MALSDALALCPSLATKRAVLQEDAYKLLQLARWCERYSPFANVYDQDSLWVDVTGTTHLFGDEKGLLAKIKADFLNLGYTVETALASSFGAAFALSHFACNAPLGAGIVAPSFSCNPIPKILLSLPVKALRLDQKTVSLLHRLGLLTIGQLVELPRKTLKRRFPSMQQAKSALLRLDQMFGLRPEPLIPLTPPLAFASHQHFTQALFSKQMLEQALIQLIKQVIEQLETKKQGARQLIFALWRGDGSSNRIKIGTNRPCRNETHLFTLFKEKLTPIEPGFGIDAIGLFVDRHEPMSTTQAFLADRQQSQQSMSPSILIDRLRNRLGAQKVGYLHPVESHIPERAQKTATTPPLENSWGKNIHNASQEIPLRKNTPPTFRPYERPFLLLNPAEAIKVMAPMPDAPPLLFTWRRVTQTVIVSAGPERITPEWWRETAQKANRPRDYYRVRTKQGGTFWLYRDGLYEGDEHRTSPPKWYMHGFFG